MSMETKTEAEASGPPMTSMFRIEKERYNWIDQARGFVMFILVLSAMMPKDWRHANEILWFFLDHPASSTTTHTMNFYDVGVPAFFFIIGLLMAVSFRKRVEKKGKGPALLNVLVRWGLVFVVGLLFLIVPALISDDPWFGEIETIAPGVDVFVVKWDVVIALGFVGLCSIPFLFVPKVPRLIVSYGMMGFYQVMIMIPQTYWREYAISSVHGGIMGGIFVLIPITLISSVIGEYFVLEEKHTRREKNIKLALLGALNAAIGIVLWLIPGGWPNKRQSTMSWATISIAVCILFLFLFIAIDYKDEDFPKLNPVNKGRIILFKAYGMNPLLIYAIAEITNVLVEELIGDSLEIQLILLLTLVPAITIISILLERKGKAISTTKVAAGVIVIVLVLAIVLLPLL